MRLFLRMLLAAGALAAARAEEPAPLFRNPDAPLEDRVRDLLGRLTIEEKVSQIEQQSPAIARLGLGPFTWWSEGGHGVARAGRATVFPQVIAMAATWDPALMERVASAIGDEARAKHNQSPAGRYRGLVFWSPCINLARDPRWGRVEECYGEDPYLTARMAVAYVRGMQGPASNALKTAVTPKHFAMHSQEQGRVSTIFSAPPRFLREYYLPAFRACWEEGRAQSYMAAFSGVNGFPCSANRWLLTDVLKTEWGFDGAVVTDWGAVSHLVGTYKIATNAPDAVRLALNAGVDVLCEHKPWKTNVLAALEQKRIAEDSIDRALTRALRVRFRLGEFDPSNRVPYRAYGPERIGCDAHVELARALSRASIVLLKNAAPAGGRPGRAPVLPLDRWRLESVAVLGSHAAKPYLGAYSGGPAKPPVTPLAGIRNHLDPRVVVRHVPWVDLDEKPPKPTLEDPRPEAFDRKASLAAAVQAAALSDVAVVCVGLGPKIENESKDRADLALPKDQQELVEQVLAVNPATVVVLINGGPVALPRIADKAAAIVEAWYPGEQGGNALADVLFGDYNPAGRLPITFYTGIEQLPPIADYDISKGRTYMYLTHAPLFAFGHGLSYTTFDYGPLRLDRTSAATNGTVRVSVEVRNTGPRDGEEVVQLYTRDLEASVPVALRQLRGFRRVAIPRGGAVTVTLPLRVADLAFWSEASGGWVVEPGEFEVQVGAASDDIRQTARFRVFGSTLKSKHGPSRQSSGGNPIHASPTDRP